MRSPVYKRNSQGKQSSLQKCIKNEHVRTVYITHPELASHEVVFGVDLCQKTGSRVLQVFPRKIADLDFQAPYLTEADQTAKPREKEHSGL